MSLSIFLRDNDEPIPFQDVDVANVEAAHRAFEQRIEALRQEICSADAHDLEQGLIRRDDLNNEIDSLLSPVYLMKETHPDAAVREASHKAVEAMFATLNGLKLDEELYQSLETLAKANPELGGLPRRYLDKSLDDYRRNGFRLSAEKRQELKALDDKLSQLELAFQKHIAEDQQAYFFTDAELKGLPEDFLQAHRQEDGRYRVTTAYPSYMPIMKFAEVESVRKQMYTAYLNRAKEKNAPLLVDIIKLRHQRAELLGYQSHAHIQLEDKMAKDPATVWQFIQDLANRLPEKAKQDYAMLEECAKLKVLNSWDRMFYARLYVEKHYDIDEQVLKQYFSLDNVLEGIFDVCSQLFGIQISRKTSLPVWHEAVQAYEVFDSGTLIGRFYLDLFPRPNKYNHAACFGIRPGKRIKGRYQIPESALVCNFTPPSESRPSLLTHREVETMFHEFGHLLHQQLTTSPLSCFAGTSVARDFVEMPSQIMEHWAWEAQSLRRYAKHWQTGETIPEPLLEKLLATRHFNSGIDTQQQLFYGALDMTLHDGWLPNSAEEITEKVSTLQREYTLFEAVPDTCFQAGFGHLMGYSAGYYGYLWSRVFADDMFSKFKGDQLFSREVGQELRTKVMATGDTVDADEIVRDFLGREPSMDPFLEELGLAPTS